MALRDLESAWESLDDNSWEWQGIMMAGPRSMTEIVSHHLRNIEVHHVDLDIRHRPSDWPAAFVDGELGRRLWSLGERTDDAQLLMWLLEQRTSSFAFALVAMHHGLAALFAGVDVGRHRVSR